jgi:uncharacterized protein YciI
MRKGMLAIAILTYAVPLDEVLVHIDEHRAYLAKLHAAGKLIASGPFVPRTGGALLLSIENEAELEAVVAADPFFVRHIARYELRPWAPTIGGDAVAGLARRS